MVTPLRLQRLRAIIIAICSVMAGITKGRDGRQSYVVSPDHISPNLYKVIVARNLLSCEKILTSTMSELLDHSDLSVGDVQELIFAAAASSCPPIKSCFDLIHHNLSLGTKTLDNVLHGILIPGCLVDIWGAAGVGKSHLALQICAALRPDSYAAYVCTEGAFATNRFMEIAAARGCSGEKIEVQMCTTVDSLRQCVYHQLPLLINMKNISVVVIDSIAAPFRAGEVDGNGIRRAQIIRSLGHQLKYLAAEHNIVVITLNQATDSPETGPKAALGLTWSYLVNFRLGIDRIGDRRRVFVEKASHLAKDTSVECVIDRTGFVALQ